jgi:septum formation protein
MLELGGEVLGKPRDAADATERWKRMRGQSGRCSPATPWSTSRRPRGVRRGRDDRPVRHARPTRGRRLRRQREPLHVAGRLHPRRPVGAFLDGIDGDAGNVIGLSLPLLRRLLAELGVGITELW